MSLAENLFVKVRTKIENDLDTYYSDWKRLTISQYQQYKAEIERILVESPFMFIDVHNKDKKGSMIYIPRSKLVNSVVTLEIEYLE